MSFLDKYSPQLLAILRIVTALLFVEHSTMKLFAFPAAMPPMPANFAMVLMAAGIIELVTGALITLGLFSRIAAFIASGEMAFAYFLGHVSRGGFWPAINGGGEAILYCFVFLYLAAAGPGAWAINRR
jgi:putative oxidoreductase